MTIPYSQPANMNEYQNFRGMWGALYLVASDWGFCGEVYKGLLVSDQRNEHAEDNYFSGR